MSRATRTSNQSCRRSVAMSWATRTSTQPQGNVSHRVGQRELQANRWKSVFVGLSHPRRDMCPSCDRVLNDRVLDEVPNQKFPIRVVIPLRHHDHPIRLITLSCMHIEFVVFECASLFLLDSERLGRSQRAECLPDEVTGIARRGRPMWYIACRLGGYGRIVHLFRWEGSFTWPYDFCCSSLSVCIYSLLRSVKMSSDGDNSSSDDSSPYKYCFRTEKLFFQKKKFMICFLTSLPLSTASTSELVFSDPVLLLVASQPFCS
ncbi:hypothetical protein ISN44_As06g037160 [Arabidopsis suecica]|uniref:Uncharacterized protein n=1 Tax=Arabidopsis suecica TaxID=45249 RepID=A0A8T2CGN3_ARASU|nr:hypothetical protein ISN44_As06g037160 [Arabidopsis suecica]KAG7599538.1 hypothetical protein ISN44_As06g037160 [Arabidopsis suecica]